MATDRFYTLVALTVGSAIIAVINNPIFIILTLLLVMNLIVLSWWEIENKPK